MREDLLGEREEGADRLPVELLARRGLVGDLSFFLVELGLVLFSTEEVLRGLDLVAVASVVREQPLREEDLERCLGPAADTVR